MKRWFWTTLLGLSVVVSAKAADVDLATKLLRAQDTFQQAKSKEDYLKAAAMYQEILDAGIVNGTILYDQGNAFMKAGERGRAIACYRQAKIYHPRDPYLDANLQYALGSPAGDVAPLAQLYFWRNWIGYREIFTWMMVFGCSAFVLAMIPIFRPNARILTRLSLVPAAATLLLAAAGAMDWYRFDYLSQGVVTATEVTARKGNADSYAPAFTKPLAEGTEFTVVDERGGWLLVQLADGPQGWIPSRDAVIF
jgi:tetratricopeptide (TPR) repeat protein